MRPAWLVLAGSLAALSARGQNAPVQPPDLPPLQQQMQQPGSQTVPRATVPQTSLVPLAPIVPLAPTVPLAPRVAPAPDTPDQAGRDPAAPTEPPATFDRPNVWLPAGVAKLQALDKVNAKAAELTIDVGKSATFGSLTIAVKACAIRPPDQPADAAAYLDVTDSHSGTPGFQGWMLQEEPSVSMMQNPVYDIRVAGCS